MQVCAEATARVWAHVEARQLLALKRFVAETGPKEPLNLAWWGIGASAASYMGGRDTFTGAPVGWPACCSMCLVPAN